ncbi:hypothetical protein ACHAPT_003953 [Fusarium lateritium]
MPGVAHVKRCDQCRQSKKKCDQIEPVCGRCERLGLRCGGAVVKRFKFVPEKFERTPNATPPRNNREKCEKIRAGPLILRNLPSESMRVAQGFISVLESPGISYDLNLLGTFFKVLPQRIDSSTALRSSVAALTGMYRSTRGHGDSTLALTHQGAAMKDIRAALQDPAEAHTPNTVLAIYVVMMSQLWEAMTNQDLTIDPKFFESLAPYINPLPAGASSEDLDRRLGLYSLGRMPKWLTNPIVYHKQISEAYDIYYAVLPALREAVDTARVAREVPNASFSVQKALAVALVQQSMITAVCALLNKAVRRIDDRNGKLLAHMKDYCNDVVQLAKLSVEFKPIAAATVPETIIDVWGVMDPSPEKDRLEAALWEFCGDTAPKWLARGKRVNWNMEEQYLLSLEVSKLKI